MTRKKFCEKCGRSFKGRRGETICDNCRLDRYSKTKKHKNIMPDEEIKIPEGEEPEEEEKIEE